MLLLRFLKRSFPRVLRTLPVLIVSVIKFPSHKITGAIHAFKYLTQYRIHVPGDRYSLTLYCL